MHSLIAPIDLYHRFYTYLTVPDPLWCLSAFWKVLLSLLSTVMWIKIAVYHIFSRTLVTPGAVFLGLMYMLSLSSPSFPFTSYTFHSVFSPFLLALCPFQICFSPWSPVSPCAVPFSTQWWYCPAPSSSLGDSILWWLSHPCTYWGLTQRFLSPSGYWSSSATGWSLH